MFCFRGSSICIKPLVIYVLCAGFSSSASAENLRDIFELARANDPRILAADYERQAAELEVPIARAARRPSLNLTLDRDYEYDSTFSPDKEESRTEPGLVLNIPIYNRRSNVGISIAEAVVDEAQLSFVQQEQTLFLRTADLYFAVLRAEDNVEIAQTAQEAFQSQVELATELVAERLVSSSDVKEAQASLESARASVIDAQNQFSATQEALRVAIGTYPPVLAAIREDVSLDEPDPADVDAWVEKGIENNPTLRLTQLQLERSTLQVDLARSGRYPTLGVLTTYTYTDSDRESSDGSKNGEIALQLNMPLYQGGGVQARIAQANLRRELTTQQLSFTQRGVEQQIRNSFANVTASIGRAGALEQAVISNEASLEGIRIGVEVQTRTIVDLLDAISRLTNARVELSGARYDYLFNLLALKSFVGELSLDDLSLIDQWLQSSTGK